MSKPIKVGIIGFGLSGRVFHAPFINTNINYQLEKIISSRFEEIKNIYPDVKVARNVYDLYKGDEIDLVIVASPNVNHFDQAKQALMNNKHVIIEKPFVVNYKDGQDLITLSKKKKKILAVFHNRRWDGDFLTVQKIIKEKLLGDIVEYEAHFDRYRPEIDNQNWRNDNLPGSGVFYDLGPHLIDQALCLFGKPNYVYADIKNMRQQAEVDDSFEVKLGYNNLTATIKASVFVRELGPHFIIHGKKGSFIKYGMDLQENELKRGKMPNGKNWGKDNADFYGIINTELDGTEYRAKIETLNGNYAGFFNNVYNTILGNEELIVKPEEALESIKIIELAFNSNNAKKPIYL